MPSLNLIVIRCGNLDRACHFYTALGLELRHEQHGDGPEHYSADLGGITFEIHPLGNSPITIATRLGLRVDSVDDAVNAAQSAGGALVAAAKQTPWGYRAIIADPEGHRIELTQAS